MHELERPLSELEISCICWQMCAALEFIHSRCVIHRDIKAGNILLNAEGVAKLGISCASNKYRIKCLLIIVILLSLLLSARGSHLSQVYSHHSAEVLFSLDTVLYLWSKKST